MRLEHKTVCIAVASFVTHLSRTQESLLDSARSCFAMPVLAQELDLYPENLLGETEIDDNGGRFWWVLHTRPRQEKSLARQLHRAQIPYYLPLIPRRWRLRGRMMTSHLPLFPSYVFLRADRQERVAALSTNRVVRSLEVPDQTVLWQDLRQIHRLITAGLPIMPENRLASGMMVEITSGPLAGLRGRILRSASGQRFVVQIDFIQRGASVELDDFTLTRVDINA
jgi:transcriptional antiterminator RfaH